AETYSNQVISLTDMLSTFDFLSNNNNQATSSEDGYNIWPAFIGQEVDGSAEMVRVFHSVSGVFAIRKGDWKLIQGTKGSGSGSLNIPQDSLNLIGQLYNLDLDPAETNDLWDQYPELVKELINILEGMKK
ncbi:MAG: hypothetical protein J7L96_03840, partial [Bacteroidales bacterium]|nr:hypothetical protein [Bacteroidales bacterium]